MLAPRVGILLSLIAAAALAPGVTFAAPVCAVRPAAAAAVKQLTAVMQGGRFISYQPTQIRVFDGVATKADRAGIEADLKALRSRFDGLITYSSSDGAELVPDVAAKLGFRAVVMGLWNPADANEVARAAAAAARQPALVVGLSVGNERIFAKEIDATKLAARIAEVRKKLPQLALATTEPFHIFSQPAAGPVLQQVDFLLINAHPVFQPWFKGASDVDAARFVSNVLTELGQHYCGPLLIKETGVPTAPSGEGYTAARQASFYKALQAELKPTEKHAFAYFSAFDAPWRVHDSHPVAGPQPQEGSWGIFDDNRKPKAAALGLSLLK